MAKKQFKAESKRLLDLMINSIYTHKEIFLREIISNASDAIDKLCYLALTDPNVGMRREDFEIILTLDQDARTLTVSDNGIGMDDKDLETNLGIIAFSGTGKFRDELGEKAANGENTDGIDTDVIGQFGVGFYSSFMVADRVTVITKKYGCDQAFCWESDGTDGFTIKPCEKDKVGTDIIMHIRQDGEEADEFSQYLREYTLKNLVKKYSDYVRFPVKMLMSHSKLKDGCPEDKPEYEQYLEMETLNSMVPIWKRKKSEVSKEEYEKFYQEHFSDMQAPQTYLPVSVEGLVSYDALIFIPSKTPFNYFTEEFKPGLQLYSAGVMIMDRCEDLLPSYFNFVCGIVDSPDLSLNISREMLQHDRQLKMIRDHLEKKIKGELERMLGSDREGYEKFFGNFGRQLKICCLDNYGAQKDNLKDLLMFWSSKQKKLITLKEYKESMPEEQKYIYYASGFNVEGIDKMPQTEILKEKGFDILYFTDQVDEFVAEMFRDYDGSEFKSCMGGDLGLEEDKKNDDPELYKDVLGFIKETLGDRVDEVKASSTLKSHPVCMSAGEGISFEMERYFNAVQPEFGMKAKRVLEINVNHPAYAQIDLARTADPEKAKKFAEILYNQALLIAGFPIENPSDYTDLLCSLWN